MDGSEWELLSGEKSEEGLSKTEYMLLHPRCAVCHWPAERWGRHLELHHIVGGAGRKDLPCGSNWVCICNRCHYALHSARMPGYSDLTKGAVLTAKIEEDGPVDESKLAALKHRKCLPYDQCPIPEEYVADRHRRGGEPWP